MVALYNYMSQILVELIKLANLIISMTRAAACARRIQSVFEIRSSMPDTGTAEPGSLMGVSAATEPEPAAAGPAVGFCHLDLRLGDGGEDALSDIDFSVMPGETVGIIGGTGSGKSSLVNLIPRFYDATGGSVRIYGHDVKDYPVKSLRELVGVVPQKAALFHGSIRENLQWGKKDASDDEIMEAVRTAQAEEVVLGKEGGLDYEIEQGGRNLSGGQKQRLTIARALVKKPGILILDDSSSALDFATDAALRAAVRELSGQMTVFIVSQRASSILHADKILVLDDGKVAGMGTSEELLQSCQVYREIYETQFRKEAANR